MITTTEGKEEQKDNIFSTTTTTTCRHPYVLTMPDLYAKEESSVNSISSLFRH